MTLLLVEVGDKAMETLSLCYSILMSLLWDWVLYKELIMALSALLSCGSFHHVKTEQEGLRRRQHLNLGLLRLLL